MIFLLLFHESLFKFIQHDFYTDITKLSISNEDNPNDWQRNGYVFMQEYASYYVRIFTK